MDREEMIMKMIRDYYPNDTSGDEELKEAIAKGGYANIVRFFDLGYRKFTEGTIMMTKEELEAHDKEATKKTAREIIKEVKAFLDMQTKVVNESANSNSPWAIPKKCRDCYVGSQENRIVELERIAEKCGVEVE